MLYEFLAKNRIGNRTVTSCQILRIVLEYLQYVLLLKESSDMELLKQRILQDGEIRGGNVLKVDSFLNHQLDIPLFEEIGQEFQRLFADKKINKILTIESSGIAVACIAARYFNVPVVFAKKTQSINIDGAVHVTRVQSVTNFLQAVLLNHTPIAEYGL